MSTFYAVSANVTNTKHNKRTCSVKFEGELLLCLEDEEYTIPVKGTVYQEYIEVLTASSGILETVHFSVDEWIVETISKLELNKDEKIEINNEIEESLYDCINIYN